MNKRKIRDWIRLFWAMFFCWLYIPHLVFGGGNKFVISDVNRLHCQSQFKRIPLLLQLVYHLHNNRYFRSLFYHRIGPIKASIIQWYRPGDRYFNISATTKIGEAMLIAHPFSTIINAESIGSNFSCIHCTTLGATSKGRPTLGNNVSLGANVTIIGNVHIGNNVTIGAGSVVVKDIPNNCIAVGNPCKPIRFLEL